MIVKSLATALLCAAAFGAHASQAGHASLKQPRAIDATPSLSLALVRGGEIATEPVIDGRLAYLATGRVVATWDYTQLARPLRVATSAPVEGAISGMAKHGDYLYVTWRGMDSTSGVAVYSLANPRQPALAWQGQYTDADFQSASGLAVASGHLYLFDSENGTYVADLSNPALPAFQRVDRLEPPIQYERVKTVGTLIHASGHNLSGDTVFDTYDTSQPRSPQRLSRHVLPGIDAFSIVPDGDRAVSVGWQFSTYGLGVPGELTQLSSTGIYGALSVALAGNRAWTFGFNEGLKAWDIRNLSAPRLLGGNTTATTLGARHAAVMRDRTLLLPTATDLLHAYNTRPAIPHRLSTSWLPGGTAPMDVAMHEGDAVLLQSNYGLTVNAVDTLAPQARFEANLPEELQSRAFSSIAVSGDVAYLAAWGYGLITVDLSGPKPTELGRLEVPYAAVVAVAGHHAYVGRWTDGGGLYTVDVSNPAKPKEVGLSGLDSQPYRLQVAGDMAYLATGGGLRLYSLADPARPVEIGRLDDGCGTAFDLSVDASRSRVYLACNNGMQVVDVSQPAEPVVVGRYASLPYVEYTKVAHRGERVWFADIQGLHEIDVANPAQPARLALSGLGHAWANRVTATGDGRVLVASSTGVHVFAPTP